MRCRDRAASLSICSRPTVDVEPPLKDSAPDRNVMLPAMMGLPEGYTTEVNLAATTWISEVATVMRRGFVLTVDYGFPRHEYYAPTRTAGTLSAYANHRCEPDVLARPVV